VPPSVTDVRWFGRNDYEHLIVPDLRRLGLDVATEGDAPARLAIAMNHDLAPAVWRYSHQAGTPFVSYVWDLPPSRIGNGRYDPVLSVGGRLLALPRIGRRYVTRRGYYSRLRFVAAHAAAVWSPSNSSAADVARHFGREATPVHYCYNSHVFTSECAARRPPILETGQPTPYSLLSISRLVPEKNQAAVIRAAARVGGNVELIGRGPAGPALEALARELGVSCRMRSGLSGQEVVAAYHRASVVVCPSRFEGLGLTGIEGAICGTPVVASDIPAHREFLSAAAHFFTLDDDDSLIDAIERARVAAPPPTDQFSPLTIPAAAQRFFDRLQPLLTV
jgi:glycosyltransferase involved in cell wall biosynthesis